MAPRFKAAHAVPPDFRLNKLLPRFVTEKLVIHYSPGFCSVFLQPTPGLLVPKDLVACSLILILPL